jgi:hypothetical protein
MSEAAVSEGTAPHGSQRRLNPRLRLALVAGIALGFGAVVLFVHDRGAGTSATPATTTTTASSSALAPTAFSAAGLVTFARSVGHTVYWAGPRAGMSYEVTESPSGSIYVRYLPAGVAVGSPTLQLIVATYPVTDAYTATSGAAAGTGARVVNAGTNVIAFYNVARPTNIYEALRGSNFQIEVYSPSVKQALGVVTGLHVTPVGD